MPATSSITSLPARVVIDTNVLLDFWVFRDAAAQALIDALQDGRLQALYSDDTDLELVDVLSRRQFALPTEQQQQLLQSWRRQAQRIERVFAMQLACSDPHDQKFIDLALSAQADALITKDKALLKLARRARKLPRPVQIVPPAALFSSLEILNPRD